MYRLLFFLYFISFTIISPAQIPTAGLVAYYPFNGDANEQLHITPGIDGVLNGVTPTNGLGGIAGSALHFNGQVPGSRVDVADNSIFDFGLGDYSVSLWLRYTSPQTNNVQYSVIYGKGGFEDASPGTMAFVDYYQHAPVVTGSYLIPGSVTTRTSHDDYASVTAGLGNAINNNEWHHFIFMRNGNRLKIFIDGALAVVRENSIENLENNYPLRFGANQDDVNSQNYIGDMDEVRFYNRALCETEISQLYNHDLPASNITDGLVAFYPFNGNTNDESGNNNHLTNNGAIQSTDRNNQANSAYYFDGSDDYMNTAPSNSLNSVKDSSGYSFCAWVNTTGDYFVFCKPSGSELHYRFHGNTSQMLAECDNYYSYGTVNVTPHEWTFVAAVKKGNKIYFYKNGYLITSNITAADAWPVNINTDLEIGRDAHGPVEYMNGKLDQIRIYNRSLTDAEILFLYNSEKPVSNISNGLVAYYPFNGNANDESGNGNHCTTINAAPDYDRFGAPNKAYSFDGSSSYIKGIASSVFSGTDISISLWAKTNGPGSQNPRMFGVGPAATPGQYYSFILEGTGNPRRLEFYSGYGGGINLFSDTYPVENGAGWKHYVVVYKNNQAYFYTNGLLCGVSPYSNSLISFTNAIIQIGHSEGGTDWYDGSLDDIRVYNRALTELEINELSGLYTSYNCVQWNNTPPVLDPESKAAFDHLCSKNIINHNQISGAENNTIRKDELAKILFRGLFEPDINAATPVDDAPNPFIDLQPINSAYVKEAKALCYLEYEDGISVFKREFTHFKPQYAILRKHVIKALLETFNIKPYTQATAPIPNCWYNDVPATDEMYYYILKAREMGFIRQQTSFSPNNPVTRKETFLILYRILKYFETTSKPVPVPADYFIPCNIKPDNYARSLGISDGNFNAYTKTSFAIAGLMPLTFVHSYNSAYTELPENGYNLIEPLGKGWTHNYNCFLQKVDDEDPLSPGNKRTVITWGDGTMNSFEENAGVFTPESKGVYATLTAAAGQNVFTYKTKSQVSYEFTRQILSTRSIWVLTSVKDRNNNSLTLTWTPYPVNQPTETRLFKVEDAGGRYLQFAYHTAQPSKIDSVKSVTGSITRSIQFDFLNDYTDLKYYINPKGDTTHYYYEDINDATRSHLLKQIKLPKGNIVDNSYEQRKLKSTQMGGQYQTNVNTAFNYTATNNTNFTESIIATTRAGNTFSSTIKQDQLGNVKNAVSPTGNLLIDYTDPAHASKPTSFNNSINNLSATTNYDAAGNVTSVTKTGGGFNLKDSFTYNGFNDILTYINARGNKTEFTYNSTGNLTKIKDALNNETNMLVNANGTVSRVTNPEGIYTEFMYDAFGNTTQSKLMNAITSNAVYDDASRLIQKTDPNGTITTIGYDVNDLVLQVIADPGGLNNTVRYNYDKNDNLDTITNPKGGKTALTYNAYDQLVEYRFGGFAKTYAYNEDGTLNTFTNQNGNSFAYAYNGDGTLYSDGYASYSYDGELNLQTIASNLNGKAIQFGYDALKRTNSVSYNDYAGNTVLYDYDNNNNVTAITYPGGFKVGYEYDELDRLTRVYNFTSNANFATYTYYNDGRLKDQLNGNGTKTVYRYDSFGRLDSIGNFKSTNDNIASYKFSMDNVGNHTSETSHEPALPLLAALATEGVTYAHDDANRMNSRGSTTFTYDNNGNNTAATGDWSSNITFDTKDNLLTSTTPALTCEYDALENRRRKNDTLYVLDILGGSNVLIETDASGNPYAYYIHGLGLICRLDAAQTNPAYYHYDYRGSTTAITNSSETVTHSYRYGAFGEMLLASETGFKNPYRYVGKYGVQYEGDSLYFMRARYYNAVKGRFLGEDPVWGVNLFAYSKNNPINYFDTDGQLEKGISESLELQSGIIEAKIKSLEERINSATNPFKEDDIKRSNALKYLNNLIEDVIKANPDEIFNLTSYIDNYYNSFDFLKETYTRNGKKIKKDTKINNEVFGGTYKVTDAGVNDFFTKLIAIEKDKKWTWGNKKKADQLRSLDALKLIYERVSSPGNDYQTFLNF